MSDPTDSTERLLEALADFGAPSSRPLPERRLRRAARSERHQTLARLLLPQCQPRSDVPIDPQGAAPAGVILPPC